MKKRQANKRATPAPVPKSIARQAASFLGGGRRGTAKFLLGLKSKTSISRIERIRRSAKAFSDAMTQTKP